jgi:signal transduction histidine kinase
MLMKAVFLFFFVSWGAALLAQDVKTIQQLKKTLTTVSSDTARSRLLMELGIQYEQSNLDSCLLFLNQSLQAAQRSRNSYAIARVMHRMGYTHLYLTKDESKAIEWLNRGIAVAKPAKDYTHLARCFQLLSVISNHQGTGNFEDVLKQALAYAKMSNDWRVLVDSYTIYGEIMLIAKKTKQAELLFKEGLSILEKHDHNLWFNQGVDVAGLLKKNGKPEQAKLLYQKLASAKDKLSKSTKQQWFYLNDVARVERGLKHYAEAEYLLLKGIGIEQKNPKVDTFHLYFYYQSLIDLYLDKQDYKKAYESEKTLQAIGQWLKEKRQTQDSKLKMTQFKAALDMEKKEAEISILAEKQKEQQILLIAATIIGVLLIGFVVIQQRNRRRIERQKAELASLNNTKDQLMSIIAHDLRSPIGLLRDSFDLMDNNLQSPEETKQFLAQSRERIERVHGSMENLLVWALAQRNGLNPKFTSVKVADLVAEQLDAVQDFARRKNITLQNEVSSPLTARADHNQLSIVLNNLLQNAIKFTPKGGTIRVTAEETNDQTIALKVTDTGVGMDVAAWKKQKGSQTLLSKEGTAKEKGTGLGLFLVKEIIDKNEGTLHIESVLGKGTTVLIGLKKE